MLSRRNRSFTVQPLIPDDARAKLVEAILQGMGKTIASGVTEYRIGSRSLKRWTPGDIAKLLELTATLQSPPTARRAIPSDL